MRDTLKNVYVDTAASPFLYDSGIYLITSRICGVEHILLGTDYPLIEPERYFREMKASGLSAIQIQRICGQNAMRLLRINA